MHDPLTVAFEIRYPWKAYKNPKNDFEREYRDSFCTIWHVDPETDGTDDSCGWFMRSRHGNKKVLEKIVKSFEFNWDRTFTSDYSKTTYCSGLFFPNGMPHLSVMGIVLNLFFAASIETFGSRTKAVKYIQSHLFEILLFAENNTDSIGDSITLKFGNDIPRNERMKNMASIIYSYILRDIRPWYKHPRWHIHHWKLQVHPLESLKRWMFTKCCKCGRRFCYGETGCTSNWESKGPRWFVGEKNLMCSTCSPTVENKSNQGM